MAGKYITYAKVQELMKDTTKEFYSRFSLSPSLIADLDRYDVISTAEMDKMNAEKLTPNEKKDIILKKVAEAGVKAFLNLCHVLCENAHEHIVEEVWELDVGEVKAQRAASQRPRTRGAASSHENSSAMDRSARASVSKARELTEDELTEFLDEKSRPIMTKLRPSMDANLLRDLSEGGAITKEDRITLEESGNQVAQANKLMDMVARSVTTFSRFRKVLTKRKYEFLEEMLAVWMSDKGLTDVVQAQYTPQHASATSVPMETEHGQEKLLGASQHPSTTAPRAAASSQEPRAFKSQNTANLIPTPHHEPTTSEPMATGSGEDMPDAGKTPAIKNASESVVEKVMNDIEGHYQLSKRFRGRTIIINNHAFKSTTTGNFEGGPKDGKILRELFHGLLFEVDDWVNLKKKDLKKKITEEIKKQNEGDYDAFIVFVLSHGGAGTFLTTDGKTMKIMTDLAEKFDTVNVPKLANKPKLLFFDACRGKKIFQAKSEEEQLPETVEPHRMADFLFYSCTFPGHLGFIGPDGSTFVQELVSVFSDRSHEDHVLEMITKVTRRVDAELIHYEDKNKTKTVKQLPECSYTLKRLLYFLPGYIKDE